MTNRIPASGSPDDEVVRSEFAGTSLRRALGISLASLTWSIAAGAAAFAIGTSTQNLALTAFGAISMIDAGGSATLVLHFRHTLRHEAASARLERLALQLVTWGMLVIGLATLAESIRRLVANATTNTSILGLTLAGSSVIALAIFARAKSALAGRVESHALRSDGWVSAMGSLLAAVTLVGSGASAALNWTWVDSTAAILIGCGAVVLSFRLRHEVANPA